jgi:sugar phosphate isomerase/epimerase
MTGKNSNLFTVFSKPWPDKSLAQLSKFVKELGFDGVELPVRPNFQVTPEKVSKGLPEAARIFEDNGVKIRSVAGPTNAETIAACGKAGVPILRVMARIDMSIGYYECEKRAREEYDVLLPALEEHGVTIGVQNHADYYVGSAIGLMHLIEDYDPKLVGAVLDPAHCGLDGEPEDMAIDIVWSHLVLVNLKNAFWKRVNGPEAQEVTWKKHWTTGRRGLASWPMVAAELKRRGYRGDYCLTAEYSNPSGQGDLTGDAVNRLITEDIVYARSLFE